MKRTVRAGGGAGPGKAPIKCKVSVQLNGSPGPEGQEQGLQVEEAQRGVARTGG